MRLPVWVVRMRSMVSPRSSTALPATLDRGAAGRLPLPAQALA
jgi:hypothetical protein